MAERLTRKIGYEYEKAKRETQLLKINNKLGKLEDILEKYGIESVEELDKKIADGDTWKRACEFACDVLRDINYKIYNEDRIDFENTFYQQAKKEGDDE